MSEIRISVKGMSCGHCVAAVEKALKDQEGVDSVSVSLEEAEALVSGSPDRQALLDAIVEEGYEAELIS